MAFPPYQHKDNYRPRPRENVIPEHAIDTSPHLDFTDTVNFHQDSVSHLYNNPAIFADATTKSKTQKSWSWPRLCMFLCPALTVEFCRVFACMFMFVDIMINAEFNIIPLLLGGFVGLTVIICVSKFFSDKEQTKHSRRRVTTICLIFYHAILLLAISCIVGSSWSDLFYEGNVTLLNGSTVQRHFFIHARNESPLDQGLNLPTTPFWSQILHTFGYILLSSATGSGQYFNICLALHVANVESQKLITDITVVLTAIGACVAGFIGTIDMASNWCPADICPAHVTAQAAVISSFILCLLVVSTLSCLLAYYSDGIRLAWKRSWPPEDSNWDPGRRSTRTAQEIFDECAPLLRDHETSFSSSHMAGNSYTTDDTDKTPNGVMAKKYPHQITSDFQEPTMTRMLKNKNYIGALLSILLLSGLLVIFQFYSTSFLSRVLPITNTTGVKVHGDEIDWSHVEAPLDVSHVFGLKINGLGVFLSNFLFIVVYLKRSSISRYMKPEWKGWILPIMLLLITISASVTGATGNVIVFLVTSCLVGLARVVESILLHTMVPLLTRTWPPVELKLTNGPTTFLWSQVPLSLMLSTLVVSLVFNYTHNPAVSMYSTAVFASLAGISFFIAKNKVI